MTKYTHYQVRNSSSGNGGTRTERYDPSINDGRSIEDSVAEWNRLSDTESKFSLVEPKPFSWANPFRCENGDKVCDLWPIADDQKAGTVGGVPRVWRGDGTHRFGEAGLDLVNYELEPLVYAKGDVITVDLVVEYVSATGIVVAKSLPTGGNYLSIDPSSIKSVAKAPPRALKANDTVMFAGRLMGRGHFTIIAVHGALAWLESTDRGGDAGIFNVKDLKLAA